jgi:hypothetical protein
VPVLINGVVSVPFIIDSGAGDVALPMDVFLTLLRTGSISKSDFVGKGKYHLADGSVVENDQYILHEMKVGHHVLRNVRASIENVRSTPLLGQSFLSRFSSWSLDYDRHIVILVSRKDDGSPVSMPSDNASAMSVPGRQSAVLCGRSVDYVTDAAKDSPFLGVWTGTWSNQGRLCGGLVVEHVRSDGTAQALYVYGSNRVAWKQQHVTGVIRGDKFIFQDDQSSTFIFDMNSQRSLAAVFKGASGSLTAIFERQ